MGGGGDESWLISFNSLLIIRNEIQRQSLTNLHIIDMRDIQIFVKTVKPIEVFNKLVFRARDIWVTPKDILLQC